MTYKYCHDNEYKKSCKVGSISPSELLPTIWCKLPYCPLQFTPFISLLISYNNYLLKTWYLPKSSPMIRLIKLKIIDSI